jgi:hypothetical protein
MEPGASELCGVSGLYGAGCLDDDAIMTIFPPYVNTLTMAGMITEGHDFKSQYTTVNHSRPVSEHTYTSDPHGLGTLNPI